MHLTGPTPQSQVGVVIIDMLVPHRTHRGVARVSPKPRVTELFQFPRHSQACILITYGQKNALNSLRYNKAWSTVDGTCSDYCSWHAWLTSVWNFAIKKRTAQVATFTSYGHFWRTQCLLVLFRFRNSVTIVIYGKIEISYNHRLSIALAK